MNILLAMKFRRNRGSGRTRMLVMMSSRTKRENTHIHTIDAIVWLQFGSTGDGKAFGKTTGNERTDVVVEVEWFQFELRGEGARF